MKALALQPGTTNLRLVDRPEPTVTADDDVKLQVIRVGICGTDREEAAGGRAKAPDGARELVVGHEMLGRVVEVGKTVTRVKPGDCAVFTVRRGCGRCLPCAMNRSDMCETGDYRERGIWGLDGYQAQFVVDREQYVVRVPPALEPIAVLTEPLTIAEKAIDEAVRLQVGRLPDATVSPNWLYRRRCLVAGLGPVGLLAAMALRLRGAEVLGLDVVDAATARPRWLEGIGGRYVDGRQVPTDKVDDHFGQVDLILEAAGIAALEFNLLDALGVNGVYALTGIPGGDSPLQISGAELIRQLVLDNQVMIGSVNAARGHFEQAVEDLERAQQQWGDHVAALITNRHRFDDVGGALAHHGVGEIKVVVEWQTGGETVRG
ncbi:MAG: glucose 1-dehydrogenase [Acidobacteriota bacterium]|nr:glucose 1-dehydrogenase [Acidobacteriota bacterium]